MFQTICIDLSYWGNINISNNASMPWSPWNQGAAIPKIVLLSGLKLNSKKKDGLVIWGEYIFSQQKMNEMSLDHRPKPEIQETSSTKIKEKIIVCN